jgi:monoamine oxidase
MGTTFSSYRVASKDFFELASIYSSVIQRISLSPGLPVENPSPSLWSKNEAPPDIPVPDKLPAYADVVIIGSGMTGAAFAHTVLERSDDIKSIVVLDARSICGGATGRNGGHCKGETWGDYVSLREKYGNDGAQRIQRFRRTSLKDLLFIDKEYCEGKGDVRNVDTLDCFYTEDGWEGAKEKLAAWRDAMGEDGERKEYTHRIWEGEVARNVSLLPISSSEVLS